jgi:hypothetical protein
MNKILAFALVLMLAQLGTFSTAADRAAASPCQPLSVEGGSATGSTPIRYFSANYSESREKFLQAAMARGLSIEKFLNPGVGPGGERLYTDVVLIGPRNAEKFLVLSSGTHGVEGFAGSGIQTGLLNECVVSVIPDETAVLMIHAINPYGMAYLRRFNEDNVDVNRDFVDHSKPYTKNEPYDRLASLIEPEDSSDGVG